MLHAKFRGNRPAGSREEDFEGVLPYGHDGHLGHVTRMPRTNFHFPYPMGLHIKFGFDRPHNREFTIYLAILVMWLDDQDGRLANMW